MVALRADFALPVFRYYRNLVINRVVLKVYQSLLVRPERGRNQEWVLRDRGATASSAPLSHDFRCRLKIEISGQHHHVTNCHAAWSRQHERHHVRHLAGLQQTSRLPGFLQLLRRPVSEQCADDGTG